MYRRKKWPNCDENRVFSEKSLAVLVAEVKMTFRVLGKVNLNMALGFFASMLIDLFQ